MISPYDLSPACILSRVGDANETTEAYCAGFELSEWRCDGLADNLIEWIIDYALKSDELKTLNHTNSYIRLREAAARVYISAEYQRRGEVAEIAAHAICRKYFGTIPVAPRLNYLTASNDPVKAFDLVHVRYKPNDEIELWLGEAKFYKDRVDTISKAIASITSHIDRGFLTNEKLLLGPQVSGDIKHSSKIRELLSSEVSLDKLIENAVFPVLIAANSDVIPKYKKTNFEYAAELKAEMGELWEKLASSGLTEKSRYF